MDKPKIMDMPLQKLAKNMVKGFERNSLEDSSQKGFTFLL